MRNECFCCRPASTRLRERKDVCDGATVASGAGAGFIRGLLHLRDHRCGLADNQSGKTTPRTGAGGWPNITCSYLSTLRTAT